MEAIDVMRASFDKKYEVIPPKGLSVATPLKVSVLTVCASFGSSIDLKAFHAFVSSNNIDFKDFNTPEAEFVVELDPSTETLQYDPHAKKSQKKTKKGSENFYNSFTIKFHLTPKKKGCQKSNLALKLFPNGKLQLAGSRDIECAYYAPLFIYNLILKFCPHCIETPGTFQITNGRVVMINSNFDLGRIIHQEKLKDILEENKATIGNLSALQPWRTALFQPCKYPGINAKFLSSDAIEQYKNSSKLPKKPNGQVSVLIFRSGCVIITGAKTPTQLAEAYSSLLKIIFTHYQEVTELKPFKIKGKAKDKNNDEYCKTQDN